MFVNYKTATCEIHRLSLSSLKRCSSLHATKFDVNKAIRSVHSVYLHSAFISD